MADKYQSLTQEQIAVLTSQGCTASNWNSVQVAGKFDPASVRNSHFLGDVRIGSLAGTIKNPYGIEKPCGIYNATIIDSNIGSGCRISDIGVHIANYNIADNVCIENVGTMQTNAGATFGNGVEVEVLNEGGGREVVLFDELNAQYAYITCLHRYRPGLIAKLNTIAGKYVQSVTSDRGTIASGAGISSTNQIIDVKVGPYATINSASSLVNGTILSSEEAPVTVGVDVNAEDFIIAESTTVSGGAILEKVFVGQGCQIGHQFSAAHSLFFANCEGFHGEACSIFAGPYTVTHHKSTLLIAGLFSFYNAGSGTNQSNHMYKLGPVHEGKLQRGTKTGSFSYVMWPCRVGPFSVVLGKHSSTFDTADFPFSHLEARPDGKCGMVPGLHLTTVGTVRDGAKWPKRDRRKGSVKRDVLSFDVFSPYTAGKMIKANIRLKAFQEATPKTIEEVPVGGAIVKRPILRSSQKYYRTGISIYLLGTIVEKLRQSAGNIADVFAVDPKAVFSAEWCDIAGQFMPQKRLDDLEDAIESGSISTVEGFYESLQEIEQSYSIDEWLWVTKMYKEMTGSDLASMTSQELCDLADEFQKVKSKFLKLVLEDARKEFAELSQCGFGQDGSSEDVEKDFAQVRGTYEENKFVEEMRNAIEELNQHIETLKGQLLSL